MSASSAARPGRIVVAYSGSSPAVIERLAQRFAEIITVTIDLGQGPGLGEVHDRALADGAVRAHVIDAREEFAREYVLRALRAGALHAVTLPIVRSLALAAVAKKVVDVAALEQVTAVAHGCTPGSADHRRFESSVSSLAPAVRVISVGVAKPDGPDAPAGSNAGAPARREDADAKPASVELALEQGNPTAVNGVAMPLPDLFASLRTIAAAHGFGKSGRGGQRSHRLSPNNFEPPALTLVETAHEHLRRAVVTERVDRFCAIVGPQYSELLDHGQWFTPLREALDAFVNKVEERVTGVVRLELHNGQCRTVGCTSPNAPGRPARARTAAAGSTY